MMQYLHVKLNPGLPTQNSIQQEEQSSCQQIGLEVKEETSNVLYWSIALCGAET